jgi:low affinity Fe/Cu permease
METWTTVIVAAIVALSTLGATFIQTWLSNKRFKIELGRAIDVDARKRRWEVRSKPLLKLRDELARMATRQDKLVAAAHRQHTRFSGTDEEVKKELQEAIDNWNAYLRNGNFAQILFIQYNIDLVNKVEEIRRDYQASFFDAIHYQDLNAKEFSKAMGVFERNKTKIIEVQELINKRLEKL